MEYVLAGLQWEHCLIYLDDIIVFSSTFEEHIEKLTKVFQRLREGGLKLKPKKGFFAKSSVKYLGHIVSQRGLEPDPENKGSNRVPKTRVSICITQLPGIGWLLPSIYIRIFVFSSAIISAAATKPEQPPRLDRGQSPLILHTSAEVGISSYFGISSV